MANRKAFHALRSVPLTDVQRAMVIGTVLGDGSLIRTVTGNNLRLQIDHCHAQRGYVHWKYALLAPLVLTPPAFREKTRSWRFRTISHPDFTAIGRLFYRSRRRIIPDTIGSVLTEPMSLAVWFMDDGAKHRHDGLVLNTQCFTACDVDRLRTCLAENFDIFHVSRQADKNGWRLYIQKRSVGRFTDIVRPFIQPDLAYKMISPVETTRQPPTPLG